MKAKKPKLFYLFPIYFDSMLYVAMIRACQGTEHPASRAVVFAIAQAGKIW
jgi:hypothetical protein